MAILTNRRGRQSTRRFKTNHLYLRRPQFSTAVNHVNESCGHLRPIVRNVISPGGSARYVCRSCFAQMRAIETRTIEVDRVRRELAGLFRNCWPLGEIPGAVGGSIRTLTPPAAKLARIGFANFANRAERRRSV